MNYNWLDLCWCWPTLIDLVFWSCKNGYHHNFTIIYMFIILMYEHVWLISICLNKINGDYVLKYTNWWWHRCMLLNYVWVSSTDWIFFISKYFFTKTNEIHFKSVSKGTNMKKKKNHRFSSQKYYALIKSTELFLEENNFYKVFHY